MSALQMKEVNYVSGSLGTMNASDFLQDVATPCCNVIIHSFIHYTLSNPQIRCVAADILWQPSSLPCLGISSTM